MSKPNKRVAILLITALAPLSIGEVTPDAKPMRG